jgi:hypothetical protein
MVLCTAHAEAGGMLISLLIVFSQLCRIPAKGSVVRDRTGDDIRTGSVQTTLNLT